MLKSIIIAVFINQACTHGLVSFGSPIANTSGSIPRGYGPPFIAANWYNFHTFGRGSSNKGRVYYRSTSSGRVVRVTLIRSENINRNRAILRKIYYWTKSPSLHSSFLPLSPVSLPPLPSPPKAGSPTPSPSSPLPFLPFSHPLPSPSSIFFFPPFPTPLPSPSKHAMRLPHIQLWKRLKQCRFVFMLLSK